MRDVLLAFAREWNLGAEATDALVSLGGDPEPGSATVSADTMFLSDSGRRSVGGDGSVGESPEGRERAAVWDRYEDLGLLGRGGMGEVRRVRDMALNRTMAMKLIRPELTARADVLARFVEEAQCSAQLQHPGNPSPSAKKPPSAPNCWEGSGP